MFLQAYLKNIQEKTGKSAKDFRELATAKGFNEKTKAGGTSVSELAKHMSHGSSKISISDTDTP